jgi:hypothetical protein
VADELGVLSVSEVASKGISGVKADFGIRVERLFLVNLRETYPRGLEPKKSAENGEFDSNRPMAVFIVFEGFEDIERATRGELFTTVGETFCVMIARGKWLLVLCL